MIERVIAWLIDLALSPVIFLMWLERQRFQSRTGTV